MEKQTFEWKQNVKAKGISQFTEIARFDDPQEIDPNELAKLRKEKPMTYLAVISKLKLSEKQASAKKDKKFKKI